MKREQQIKGLLGRLYNWKFKSALVKAKKIDELPVRVLNIIKMLAFNYEDCGWQSGNAFELIPKLNNLIGDLLGGIK